MPRGHRVARTHSGFHAMRDNATLSELLQNDLFVDLLLTIVILLAAFTVVRLSHRLSSRYFGSPERVYHATKSVRRLIVLLAAVAITLVWSPGFGELLTLLTVIGAGMAIALREVLLSIAGWARITFMSSYKEGDRIEINGVAGDVIDVRVLRTSLMEIRGWVDADQSTGRIVHIPNSWIFLHPLYNYTRSFKFIWNEIPITVTFRSDWRAAREIMMKYAEESAAIVEQQARKEIQRISREFLIHYSILTPFVYVRIVEDGVQLTLRYLCEARKRRGSAHALNLMMLDDFRVHPDIELAHRTLAMRPPEARQFDDLPPKSPMLD
jgi:small-conductance mechanosensitive channel